MDSSLGFRASLFGLEVHDSELMGKGCRCRVYGLGFNDND
jgi:hypothetical protein